MGWLKDTFSAEAKEDDLIKSRSLNTTRIASLVVPVLGGISTGILDVLNKEPFNDAEFQRALLLAMVGFVAVVLVADMFARAIAAVGTTSRTVSSTNSVAATLPAPMKATLERDHPKRDLPGKLIAFRASNAEMATNTGEYFFVPDDTEEAPRWSKAGDLTYT